jgi:hypothetical protein
MNALLLAVLLLADPVPPAPAPAKAPAAAAPAPAATAAATPGWRAARFGMTPAEVLAALPKEASAVSPPVKLADGNTIEARIDGFAFEGQTFEVRFIFEGGKLALVSLRTPQKTYVDAEAYGRLRDALVKAWGAPLEDTADANFIDMRQTRWDRGAERADLKYIPGVAAIIHYPRPAAQ